jgi:hypothetical protein
MALNIPQSPFCPQYLILYLRLLFNKLIIPFSLRIVWIVAIIVFLLCIVFWGQKLDQTKFYLIIMYGLSTFVISGIFKKIIEEHAAAAPNIRPLPISRIVWFVMDISVILVIESAVLIPVTFYMTYLDHLDMAQSFYLQVYLVLLGVILYFINRIFSESAMLVSLLTTTLSIGICFILL